MSPASYRAAPPRVGSVTLAHLAAGAKLDTGVAPATVSARLKERGVLMNAINDRQVRAVTHYDVDRAACTRALELVADAVAC